jgi:hypothetical protein
MDTTTPPTGRHPLTGALSDEHDAHGNPLRRYEIELVIGFTAEDEDDADEKADHLVGLMKESAIVNVTHVVTTQQALEVDA